MNSLPTGVLHLRLKALQDQLEFYSLQEEFIKEEQRSLRRELLRSKKRSNVSKQFPFLWVSFTKRLIRDRNCFCTGTSSNIVKILSTLDREMLRNGATVAMHRHSNAVVEILPPEADSSIALMSEEERPDVSYSDVGGLDVQSRMIREAVELPLSQFALYQQIGIDPPRGVLLYGPPGTERRCL